MKSQNRILSSVIFGMLFTTGAFATDTTAVTSKSYVDTVAATKQNKIGGGNANTVITNTGNDGTVGSKGVYQTGGNNTYNAQQNSLIAANQANTAIQTGLNAHVTCYEYQNNDCVLWQLNELSGTYMPE